MYLLAMQFFSMMYFMSEKELNPDSLAFWSFYHSQGNQGIQRNIFAYVFHAQGIKPNLKPNEDELKRYMKYVTGSHKQTPRHVEFLDPGETLLYGVKEGFKLLRAEMRRKPETYKRPLDKVIGELAWNMMATEERIFGDKPVWTNANGLDRGRQERIRSRVASGHPSLLLYHGQEQQTTGFRVLDDMYQATWDLIAGADAETSHYGLRRESHRQTIDHAIASISLI
jgi:hypothetical protein